MAVKEKVQEISGDTAAGRDPAKEPVMYLGPSIPRMGLKTNMLFKNGIPEQFDREPVKRLFASPLEIQNRKKSIKKAGTAANIAFRSLLEKQNDRSE